MRNNKVITSLLTLGGVLLAAIPFFTRRARPRGWQRLTFWLPGLMNMNTMMGRGGMLRRMVRRRVRA